MRASRVPLVLLVGAAMLSVGALGAIPHEGAQLPLAAVIASLLPLQLGALLFAFARPHSG
jgi:hypothetical protein